MSSHKPLLNLGLPYVAAHGWRAAVCACSIGQAPEAPLQHPRHTGCACAVHAQQPLLSRLMWHGVSGLPLCCSARLRSGCSLGRSTPAMQRACMSAHGDGLQWNGTLVACRFEHGPGMQRDGVAGTLARDLNRSGQPSCPRAACCKGAGNPRGA